MREGLCRGMAGVKEYAPGECAAGSRSGWACCYSRSSNDPEYLTCSPDQISGYPWTGECTAAIAHGSRCMRLRCDYRGSPKMCCRVFIIR